MKHFYPWIDGKKVKGENVAIVSPFNGRTVGEVDFVGDAQVSEAIAVAVKREEAMAALPLHRRIEILEKTAGLLRERFEEMAQLICDEAGKPIRFAKIEVERGIDTLKNSVDACHGSNEESFRLDDYAAGQGRYGLLRRFPVGAIGAISPFNFPLNLVLHKVAPAIASGCPVVLKPASPTPLSSLLLSEMIHEAGLPEGALNVVPSRREAADRVVTDPRLKLLTFTGSPSVGWDMKARAGKKKVVLELGGNAAVIVGPDAKLEAAIPKLAVGSFYYAGQSCISVQRIFVFKERMEDFLSRFVKAVKNDVKTGDPREEGVICGPLIDSKNADRIEEWVKEALLAGAEALTGGKRKGNVIDPIVLTQVPSHVRISSEEAFGPVVIVESVDNWEAAIQKVNDSKFGLQCGVFTQDLPALWKCFSEIQVGGVIHNEAPSFRVDAMPYGGVKDSGFGREGPRYAMEDMTEPRLLVLKI
ncbi:MAG: aldehyde dehydrogenase family protein [bacterium]